MADNINDIIIASAKKIADEAVADAPYSKIRTGKIVGKIANYYTVLIDGREYPNVDFYGNYSLSIGRIVKVFIPENRASQMFIIPPPVAVDGDTVQGDFKVSGDVIVGGNIIFEGGSMGGDINVEGDANIAGDLNLGGGFNWTLDCEMIFNDTYHLINTVPLVGDPVDRELAQAIAEMYRTELMSPFEPTTSLPTLDCYNRGREVFGLPPINEATP